MLKYLDVYKWVSLRLSQQEAIAPCCKIAAETAASIRTSRRLTLNFKPILKDEPFLIQSRTIYSQVHQAPS